MNSNFLLVVLLLDETHIFEMSSSIKEIQNPINLDNSSLFKRINETNDSAACLVLFILKSVKRINLYTKVGEK